MGGGGTQRGLTVPRPQRRDLNSQLGPGRRGAGEGGDPGNEDGGTRERKLACVSVWDAAGPKGRCSGPPAVPPPTRASGSCAAPAVKGALGARAHAAASARRSGVCCWSLRPARAGVRSLGAGRGDPGSAPPADPGRTLAGKRRGDEPAMLSLKDPNPRVPLGPPGF